MKRSSILAMALALAVAAPAAAEPEFTASETASSVAVLGSYASVVVITAPIWLTVAGFKASAEGSERRSAAKREGAGKQGKAGPLPPLTVEKVEQQPDGGCKVSLKNPEAPDDLAVVQWPARADTATPAVKQGDVLAFTPTETGAGWMVADAKGTALAFMPTTDAAASNLSERW
ncbi:hypothetical protein [Stenotrophomonas sp.]|uniref:hypothetical protein n=1 Tax=Stenotrophomonas sp. TaxID=69392 RepID=UPI00289B3CF4|nr:hypothetical protein [Stenotrophomonas sp.]